MQDPERALRRRRRRGLVLTGCSGSGDSGDDKTLRLWHYEGQTARWAWPGTRRSRSSRSTPASR